MATQVFHGKIFTSDPDRPYARAIAVRDGLVVAVGGHEVVAEHERGAEEVTDTGTGLLIPGFVDAHVHAVWAGLEHLRCDLAGLEPSLEGYLAHIDSYAQHHPTHTWILGGGWNMVAFPGGSASRHDLDRVIGDRPAFLHSREHHSAWVNTAALRIAGIDRTTPDPLNGRIERDADGSPNGVLHDSAMDLVHTCLPPATAEQLDGALRWAQGRLHSFGVTGWQDACVEKDVEILGPPVHDVYLRAAANGWLQASVAGALWWRRDTPADQIVGEVRRLAEIRDRTNLLGYESYRIHSAKVMLDGTIDSHTASLLAPYSDHGCRTSDDADDFIAPELVKEVVRELDAGGFQVHFHALGDRAVRSALDAIEHARTSNGPCGNRHHLAHLQLVDPTDVSRFESLEATATIQAYWGGVDAQALDLTSPMLGSDRFERQFPFGELSRGGARLAMGSDWPVTTPNPMEAIHVAVNRQLPGVDGAYPILGRSQQLDLEVALRAYTAGSAYVNRCDGEAGTIREGARADLAMLTHDPFAVPSSEIGRIAVGATYVAGEAVFRLGQGST